MSNQQKRSNKSTSLSGLARTYRLKTREFNQTATNQDLLALLTLIASGNVSNPKVFQLVRLLAVNSITTELMDRKRKGTYVEESNPPAIRLSNSAGSDDSDGTETVHGEGDN